MSDKEIRNVSTPGSQNIHQREIPAENTYQRYHVFGSNLGSSVSEASNHTVMPALVTLFLFLSFFCVILANESRGLVLSTLFVVVHFTSTSNVIRKNLNVSKFCYSFDVS